MRDVAVDVATIIEAGTSFVGGTDLFARRLPSQAKTDKVTVWVTEDFSEVAPFVSTSHDAVTVTCNVSVRGVAGRTGLDGLRAQAFEVFSAVHRADASPYVSILATELPTLADDQTDLPVWTFPVDCTFHMDATGPLVILPPSGPLRVQAIGFPDGSTLASAPEPVDLSPYATKAGTETLANKTLASPVVSGDLLPETAGQQALGSSARPWGPGFFSAAQEEEALTHPGGTRWRYSEHPSGYARGYAGTVNSTLVFFGGIQTNSRLFINGRIDRTFSVAPAPGDWTRHSHFSGRAAVAAGQSQMVLTSNVISALNSDASAMLITPRQIDPAARAWATKQGPGNGQITVTLDAPCTNDFWFDYLILS